MNILKCFPPKSIKQAQLLSLLEIVQKDVFGRTLDREHKLKGHNMILDTHVLLIIHIHQSRDDSGQFFLCSGAKGPYRLNSVQYLHQHS